jgi:hypothetical protein
VVVIEREEMPNIAAAGLAIGHQSATQRLPRSTVPPNIPRPKRASYVDYQRRTNMSSEDYDETECKRFLGEFETWHDPTWGFYVYGTFKRPAGDDSQGNGQETTGTV